MIKFLELLVFRLRPVILMTLAPITLVALYACFMASAAPDPTRLLPMEHPYVQAWQKHGEPMPMGRLILMLEAREGTIWTDGFLRKLKLLADEIASLPNIRPHSVRSLWSPDIRYLEATSESISPRPLLELPEKAKTAMPDKTLAALPSHAAQAGWRGLLVSTDDRVALVTAEIAGPQIPGAQADGLRVLRAALSPEFLVRFTDGETRLSVLLPDITPPVLRPLADQNFLWFAGALLLALVLMPVITTSFGPGLLAGASIIIAVIWSQGAMRLAFFPADLYALTASFAVYALAGTHAIRVTLAYRQARAQGMTPEMAAREAFRAVLPSALLIGIITFLAFATLYLVPVALIRRVAEGAALGSLLALLACLVLLPLLLSYLPGSHAATPSRFSAFIGQLMLKLGKVARPRRAIPVLLLALPLFVVAAYYAGQRPLGDGGFVSLQGEENEDGNELLATAFPYALNDLTLILAGPSRTCIAYPLMKYLEDMSYTLRNTPGIRQVRSLPEAVKRSAAGWNENNPRWEVLPRNRETLGQAVSTTPGLTHLMNADCTKYQFRLYLRDRSAPTIATAMAAIESYVTSHPSKDITIEAITGALALKAARNDTLMSAEPAIMAWFSIVLMAVLVLVWRDWRIAAICLLPLLLCSAFGLGFMGAVHQPLTMPLLPVMALALTVGIGLILPPAMAIREHQNEGRNITDSCRLALEETGMGVLAGALLPVLTALVWLGAENAFLRDLGGVFALIFGLEIILVLVFMPALATVLELVFPGRPSPMRTKMT
ncbi:MAG: MMPL family transporter [Rhizobiales bacterium]|nr:MMPL family transporter [Hyphomicrobiales bacterium]